MHNMMIIEHDPTELATNKQLVERFGSFEIITTTHSGVDAAYLAETTNIDLLLLDIQLPDMDGLSFLKSIRDLDLPIDVIIISGARATQTIKTAFRYGVLDYIIKPLNYERLSQALHTYLMMSKVYEGRPHLSQFEIDRLYNKVTHATIEDLDSFTCFEDLPKGLNKLTLKRVVMYLLKENTALSAEQVAAGIGLARVTARRYLEFLEHSSKIKLEVQYGSVGRPVNRYRLLYS